MQIFILTGLVLAACVLLMSVGVLMGRKPIAGSCGGMAALGLKESCEVCGGDADRCDKTRSKRDAVQGDAESLFYDAGKNRAD